jgi:ABC-type glycerol-3-phosphate transport system permease component
MVMVIRSAAAIIGPGRTANVPGGSAGQVPWHLVMALATVMVLPVVLLFVAAQKRFVEGVAATGVKG